jgi:hypothetical protein
MPGTVRSGLLVGPTGDYLTDLSLGWIQLRNPAAVGPISGQVTVFNVKDYGAKGDGVTDDSAAINETLRQTGLVGGGTTYGPDGIYICKSTLNVTGSHSIRVLGAGPNTIFRPTAAFTGTTLFNVNQNTCVFDSFAIIPASSNYTLNPAIDAITIQGPASQTVLQNLLGFYNNGWFINAIPNGATGWFGIDMKSIYAQSGKLGLHLSASGVAGNGGAVMMTNVWMDHVKAGDAFFLEDVHDIVCNNSFAVVDTGGATGSCVHVKGACAGVYFNNTDHGGGAGYTGDSILIERNAGLTVPILITFIGGVTVLQGRGMNIWANDAQFIGFTFLNSQTDGTIINGGARISFTSCSWQGSNLSAGTAYDVNNQMTNFVHLTDCWFTSSAVTASLNGIGGAQWYATVCHATTGQPLTAGTAPVFVGQRVASGTPPDTSYGGGLNFSTAGKGISNAAGDIVVNAAAASNILFNVGGSTQAFMGNSAILTFVAGGGIDVSSAGALNVGGTNANAVNLGNAVSLVNFKYAVNALGGGAAPTLGTIGGTGPATAAQNSWLKVNINGTASFLPVWR